MTARTAGPSDVDTPNDPDRKVRSGTRLLLWVTGLILSVPACGESLAAPADVAALRHLSAVNADLVHTGHRFDHAGFSLDAGARWGDLAADGRAWLVGGFTPSADHAPVLVLAEPGSQRQLLRTLLRVDDVESGEWGPVARFVGDLDGGGRDDLAIGAPYWSDDPQAPQKGRLYVFFGERHPAGTKLVAAQADLIVEGGDAHARLGTSVAGVGDVNGDGFPDVLVGAPGCDDDPAAHDAPDCARQAGRAWLLLGGPGGLGVPEGATAVHAVTDLASASFSGEGPSDHFGWSVVGLSDLDGDGAAEFAVGALQARRDSAFHFESTSGPGYVAVFDGRTGTQLSRVGLPAALLDERPEAFLFGASLAMLGSLDGDALPELLVGAPGVPRDDEELVGAVFVWAGKDLLQPDVDPPPLGDSLSWQQGKLLDEGGMFGWAVTGLAAPTEGSDETPDMLVGSPRADSVNGRVFLLSGRRDRLHRFPPLIVFHGQGASDKGRFGWSVSTGDVNGDARPDVLIGANGISVRVKEIPGDENGRVYVFLAGTLR